MGHDEEVNFTLVGSVNVYKLITLSRKLSPLFPPESMATNKPSLDGLLIFEQPFARVGFVPVSLYLPLNPSKGSI